MTQSRWNLVNAWLCGGATMFTAQAWARGRWAHVTIGVIVALGFVSHLREV